MAGILVILSVSTCASALLNAGFVDKYYLHQKKKSLSEICGRLMEAVEMCIRDRGGGGYLHSLRKCRHGEIHGLKNVY